MSSLACQREAYAPFSLRLHHEGQKQKLALSGTLELTTHCNLRCGHCYIVDNTTRNELTTQEILRVLDEMVDAGCLWLLLTGGEVMVRKDFLEIYLAAKRRGLILTVFTNATLVTPEIADALADYPPFSIEVTLYGMTEATYEEVTGVKGSYQRCRRGIERLHAKGLPLRLKTVVLKQNQHERLDMETFAHSLGLEFRYDSTINPRLNGGLSPTATRITPEEVVQIDQNDPRRLAEWRKVWDDIERAPAADGDDHLFNCGAGLSSFHITPQGRLQVCELFPYPNVDLRTSSFLEGFAVFRALRDRRYTTDSPCQGCKVNALCTKCAGFAYLETGDPEAPVDWLCDIGHLRAEMLGAHIEKPAARATPRPADAEAFIPLATLTSRRRA
jgi:radical SAM protein with 4Fe4S-binding SPASM domain